LWKVFHNSSKFFSGLRMTMAVSILARVQDMHQLEHRSSLLQTPSVNSFKTSDASSGAGLIHTWSNFGTAERRFHFANVCSWHKADMRRSALRIIPYGKFENATWIPWIAGRLIRRLRRSGSLSRQEHEGRRNTCRIALPAEAWRQSEIAPM